MSQFKNTLIAGLAMFAMFFGSGNLVFPIALGVETQAGYTTAAIGLLLTGIFVPFLGLFSMILYQGDRNAYFSELGKWAPFACSLLMLSLLGPFGVVPRCAIVAYGGVNLLWADLPYHVFGLFFFTLVALIVWQKNKFVPLIGKWLAPFKIVGIALLILVALWQAPQLEGTALSANNFYAGFLKGYLIMDLPAAFFFCVTIVDYLKQSCPNKSAIMKTSIIASFIGGGLIAIFYIGFVVLGAHYSAELKDAQPEQYLPMITNLTLGKYATLILAVTMFLACLTTAASLSRLFADFLQKDLSKNKLSWPVAIVITLVLSYSLSLIGFAAISTILGEILRYVYPALIVLTIALILKHYLGFAYIRLSFWIAILVTIGLQLI
ncbi:MAG: branched-chain amino acid transport system II carrier protein [Rickettsiales bacterium]